MFLIFEQLSNEMNSKLCPSTHSFFSFLSGIS